MKIAIIGSGIDGQSSYTYYSAKPDTEVIVHDKDTNLDLPDGIKRALGDNYLDNLNEYDLIIRSSGINPNLILDKNPQVKEKITTQINEFMKVCPTKNIVGVTGTKGKGTTSTLITKMLEASGKEVFLGGNIGIAPLSFLDKLSPESYVVLELSSFQLSDFSSSSPHIAVCLMVVPEHLNWHKDMDAYAAAKANLFSHQSSNDIAIYFADNEVSKQIASVSTGQLLPYFERPGALIELGNIVIEDQVICRTDELKLIGEHNWQNVCAAVTAYWQIDKNVEAIKSVLTSFVGLEHRIEFVKDIDEVRYFNDSYASGLKATEAAIESIPGKKVMILGGYERMLDLDSFCNYAASNQDQFRTFVIIGESGKRLADCLEKAGFSNYILADSLKTMNDIVLKAKGLAEAGDAVVLSPGFASFDMFKNFSDRGQKFKEAVNNL
jgi:UDP-N-acetylmuramoylalanine--D-glutamate ligase